MIGFVSALSASLAIIILVALAALIAYVNSILPAVGLIQVSETKYRYIQADTYTTPALLNDIVIKVDQLGLSPRVTSYQAGCNYGFNLEHRTADEVATYNYLTMGKFFGQTVKMGSIEMYQEKEKINACFVDINVTKFEKGDDDGR